MFFITQYSIKRLVATSRKEIDIHSLNPILVSFTLIIPSNHSGKVAVQTVPNDGTNEEFNVSWHRRAVSHFGLDLVSVDVKLGMSKTTKSIRSIFVIRYMR
jgi:hypothetical protein